MTEVQFLYAAVAALSGLVAFLLWALYRLVRAFDEIAKTSLLTSKAGKSTAKAVQSMLELHQTTTDVFQELGKATQMTADALVELAKEPEEKRNG